MKVAVDPDLCVGGGLCEEICPKVFRIEGYMARVLVEAVPPEFQGACRDAVEQCPMAAISIQQ